MSKKLLPIYVVVWSDLSRAEIAERVLHAERASSDDQANAREHNTPILVVAADEYALYHVLAEALAANDHVSVAGGRGKGQPEVVVAIIGPTTGPGPELGRLAALTA